MEATFLSLIPPLIVLISAFITKKIIRSLVLGILAAGLIATNFSPIESFKLIAIKLWAISELGRLSSWSNFWASQNLFIYFFMFFTGIIITLIAHSGGTYAYSNLMKTKIKSAKSAEAATFSLSSLLFIDDYFNSLTVGSVMHAVTDNFKIPRVKLAFLVDSMAAPLCILAPVSSWIGIILIQLKESGISPSTSSSTLILANPFFVFLHVIPYIFYSLILIASVWFIITKRISFGAMYKHEKIAAETGNLFGGNKEIPHDMRPTSEKNKENSSVLDMIIPITLLFFSILFNFLYSGDFFLFGGKNGLIETLQNSNIFQSLFVGGISTLIFCLFFFFIRKKILVKEIPEIFHEGFMLMFSSIIILILAWTFGGFLKTELQTGVYLANNLIGAVDIRLFPFLFFLTGALTSFAIGSSWGAMSVLVPIAIPMLISFSKISTPTDIQNVIGIFPTLGAILSGAVFGDHTSPVAVTSIMSAKSSGSHLMDHIQTQLTYAIPVFISTCIAFLIAGFLNKLSFALNLSISLGSGILICFLILSIRNKIQKR